MGNMTENWVSVRTMADCGWGKMYFQGFGKDAMRGRRKMKRPKMILFDYGQTLVDEETFDGVKGTEAVLQYCTENKYHLTAEQIQQEANAINHELGRPTEGVTAFLEYLVQQGIRTGVISNISFCGQVVEQRIRGLFPGHPFEFILATSEYLFRKPNKRIFWLALEKAGLGPGPQLLLEQDCKTGQYSGHSFEQSSEQSSRDVWYIGDQYECDIVGAAGAGLFPIWYTGAMDMPYTPHEGVLTVGNWEEVRAVLEAAE